MLYGKFVNYSLVYMKMPYSYQEAEKLCSEYQCLVGTQFYTGGSSSATSAIIECVAISPFDQASKQRFYLFYLLFDNDAHAALLQDYKGLLFDIVIFARTRDDEMIHEDLYTWLGKNEMLNNFPIHMPVISTSNFYS